MVPLSHALSSGTPDAMTQMLDSHVMSPRVP
jgi:hypothetical protein